MATLRELIIKISANSQSFQSEISRASRMGADYHRTMEQGGRRAAAATRETRRSLSELNAQLATVRNSVIGMTGAFAGAFATSNLIRMADGYNSLSARVKLATTDAQDFAIAQKGLMDISQRTGSALSDNAALFSRASSSLREWGFGTQDILKLTDALANGLQVSGASAEETSSLIVQLSQALGRGVLRGQDFNSVAQSGQRIMKALAEGMGVAQKDLKGMADTGQLTTDKIVPALISQLGKLKDEFNSMPNSVSAASTRISNAFMEWVGGANQASGATASISGVMDGIAKNIDSVATAAGALVAVGLTRYFGGMASGAMSATAGLVNAARSEVALAQAQLRGTQISTARARAAVYRAQQALVAARGTDAQAAAERRLAIAQSAVSRNVAARSAAQTTLNGVTAVGSRLMGGALGLIGGIPGLVMLGAGAWYVMHQRQEQARESARAYINTLEEIRGATPGMNLPQVSDSESKTRAALNEQNRLIDEQANKVRSLKSEIGGYQQMLANPGPTVGGFMINHLMSQADASRGLEKAISSLAVEQERLSQMQEKSQDIQNVLAGLEGKRIAIIRQQASEQNIAYQALVRMNGQYTEFNQLLSLGNDLLASRQWLTAAPLRAPQAVISDADQQSLTAKQQSAELAGLTGLEKVRRQAEFDLGKMGRTGPENATYAAAYRKAAEDEYNSTQRVAEAQKASASATRDAEKAQRTAAQTAEQYARKMADLSIATEVQRVRANQGEKAAELFAASHENGAKWTDEQRKSIQAAAIELEKWTQNADEAIRKQREMQDALKEMKDGTRKYLDDADLIIETAGMGDRQKSYYSERKEIDRVFSKSDTTSTAAIAARQAEIDALDKKYQMLAATEASWLSGASRGYENWLENTRDIAGTVASGVSTTLNSAMDNMSAMLVGSQADWKSWGLSVLQMIARVALQMSVVNAMGGVAGSGLFGSIIGGVTSAFTGGASSAAASSGTAIQSAGANFKFNALGGVYDSPSISAYSNGVYSTPQLFAFAQGAGVFGEAGPEAIMPLTRAPDGSLGVRAVSSGLNSARSSSNGLNLDVSVNVVSERQSSDGSGNNDALRSTYKKVIESSINEGIEKALRPGGSIWNLTKGYR